MIAQPAVHVRTGFALDGSDPSPVARAIMAGLAMADRSWSCCLMAVAADQHDALLTMPQSQFPTTRMKRLTIWTGQPGSRTSTCGRLRRAWRWALPVPLEGNGWLRPIQVRPVSARPAVFSGTEHRFPWPVASCLAHGRPGYRPSHVPVSRPRTAKALAARAVVLIGPPRHLGEIVW